VVTVHPVAGGADDGPLDPLSGPFPLPAEGALPLGEFPAGGVWLSVSHPVYDEGDVAVGVCVGAEDVADPCVPVAAGCATAGSPGWLGALAAAGIARRRRPLPPG
jgi:MYXO-CTERM domain-containing protein